MHLLSCFKNLKDTCDVAELSSLTDSGPLPVVKRHFPDNRYASSITATTVTRASSERAISLDRPEHFFQPRYHGLLAQHGTNWSHLESLSLDSFSELRDVSVAILAPNVQGHGSSHPVRDLRCIYATSKLIKDVCISQSDEYLQLLIDAVYAGDEVLDFFLDRAIQALFQSSIKTDRMRKCIVTAPGPLEGMLLELELCRWIPEDNAMQPLSRNVQPALLIRHIRMNPIIASPDCSKVAQSLAAGVAGTLPALITLCDLKGQVLYQVRRGRRILKIMHGLIIISRLLINEQIIEIYIIMRSCIYGHDKVSTLKCVCASELREFPILWRPSERCFTIQSEKEIFWLP